LRLPLLQETRERTIVRDGVVSAPVEEIEVVDVPPTASVFAEKFVVERWQMLTDQTLKERRAYRVP